MVWVRIYYTIMMVLYSVALFSGSTASQAYIYPVAYNDSSSIIVAQQYESGKLRLITWNPSAQFADLMLPGYYYPVETSMLPDRSGIGFIDNDRLRIKYFNKRSATTYDVPYPLCGLNSLAWAGSHNLFFTARYHDRYALCYIALNKLCFVHIMADKQSDYLSPSYIDDNLIYIKRTKTDHEISYRIQMINQVSTYYKEVTTFEDDLTFVSPPCNTQTIAYFGSTPITHAHMQRKNFGWVIGLPADMNTQHLTFTCYIVQCNQEGIWTHIPIFVFSIPRSMLLSDDLSQKLSESLRPLLPRFIRGALYFCSAHEGGFLRIYRYDLSSTTIECLTSPQIQGHLFAPLDLGSMVICGSNIQDCVWQVFDAPQKAILINPCFKLNFLT